MIESKLIQVNKKKIAYIFVVTINVVYLRRDRERARVNIVNLYSVPVGITVSVSVNRLRCGLLDRISFV